MFPDRTPVQPCIASGCPLNIAHPTSGDAIYLHACLTFLADQDMRNAIYVIGCTRWSNGDRIKSKTVAHESTATRIGTGLYPTVTRITGTGRARRSGETQTGIVDRRVLRAGTVSRDTAKTAALT